LLSAARIAPGRIAAYAQMIAVCALFVGCSGPGVENKVAGMNDSNIKRVANLYMAYQRVHNWQGPKDKTAFTDFIQKEMPAHRLEMMQVNANDIEGLFTSERDGQPFQIRYGIGGGPGWAVAVVFEKMGVEGKRQVSFTDGSVEEAASDRYSQLLEDKGH
jgi:hypothetical protein